MNTTCNISNESNRFVIAQVSKGHNYLVENEIPQATSIMENNTEVSDQKVIIYLGINDLYNINKYISTYEELKDNIDLILVSVNPIEYRKSITNYNIEYFNDKIEEIDGVQYIDTYSELLEYGYSTVDGIHYNDIYIYIYI